MTSMNYTGQGRRPSARQIVADWKKEGRPSRFAVVYGETYAEFEWHLNGRWTDSGNDCEGVKRSRQIVADWEKAGRPSRLAVYGEGYAEFDWYLNGRWADSGNGCKGVNRAEVVDLLEAVYRVRPCGLPKGVL